MNPQVFKSYATTPVAFGGLIHTRINSIYLNKNREPNELPQAFNTYVDQGKLDELSGKGYDLVVLEGDDEISLVSAARNENLTPNNIEIKSTALKEYYPFTTFSRDDLVQVGVNIADQLNAGIDALLSMLRKHDLET